MIAVNHITLTELEWVGVLICIREEIPSKLLADHKLPHDIEGVFVESNLRKNWLLSVSHHRLSQSDDEYFFHQVKKIIDIYSKFYDRYTLIGALVRALFFCNYLLKWTEKILLRILNVLKV